MNPIPKRVKNEETGMERVGHEVHSITHFLDRVNSNGSNFFKFDWFR